MGAPPRPSTVTRALARLLQADPNTYLATVLRGEPAPSLPGGNRCPFDEYIARYGALMILKPALLACDAHRRDPPTPPPPPELGADSRLFPLRLLAIGPRAVLRGRVNIAARTTVHTQCGRPDDPGAYIATLLCVTMDAVG